MKKIHYIRYFYIIIISFIVLSCYGEGSDLASMAFDYMTIKERMLYDRVDRIWEIDALEPVRNGIRIVRSKKPNENSFPFLDIADIIIKNNDINLINAENWTEEQKFIRESAKWSKIDPIWYSQLKNKSKLEIPTNEKSVSSSDPPKNPIIINPSTSDIEINNNFISINELNDLRSEMRGCKEAIAIFQSIISRGKLITYKDRDAINERVLFCTSKKISDYLKEE